MDTFTELPPTENSPSNNPQSSCCSNSADSEEINSGRETRSPKSVITTEQLKDPALLPLVLSENQQKYLVERGPYLVKTQNYPVNTIRSQFVETSYERHLANGETVNRVWLVYSASINSVFCFCCKLFRPNERVTLVHKGFHDWKNIGKWLQEHEVSKKYLECMKNWRLLETSLCTHTTIDEANERIIRSEGEVFLKYCLQLYNI